MTPKLTKLYNVNIIIDKTAIQFQQVGRAAS